MSQLLTVPGLTPVAACRCCGRTIADSRERRKISSDAVRPLMPTLIRLLGEHYRGEKTDVEIQQLLLPTGSLDGAYICRQPCLYALQRFQKLENDLKVLHGNILGRFASPYPQSDITHDSSDHTSVLGKHQRSGDDMEVDLDPPAKRVQTQPSARRRLLYAPSLPAHAVSEQSKSPAVTVCCFR